MNHHLQDKVHARPETTPITGKIIPLERPETRTRVFQPLHEWRPRVIEKIQELMDLPRGWDGYDAPPVSFATAEFTLRMLDAICSSDCECPQIVPGTGGDLQAEWHTVDCSIELHVKAPNDVHAWRSGVGFVDEELNLTNDFTDIVKWIRALMRKSRAPAITAA
jgi:hypothetical protein